MTKTTEYFEPTLLWNVFSSVHGLNFPLGYVCLNIFSFIHVRKATAGDCALLKGTLQHVQVGKSNTVRVSHLQATPSTFDLNARLQRGGRSAHKFNSSE